MAGIIEITCDRCGYRRRLTERSRQYRFPDKQTAAIEQTLAWCHVCQRVVEAERLPSVSEIDEQITELSNDAESLMAYGSTSEEEVQRLQERKAWRLARQSPPKCLECGSTTIVAYPQDENGGWRAIHHAGCGGQLGVGYVGHALVREWPLPQYSPEGAFLTELLNEHQWATCADPIEMLKHLEVSNRASHRKLRLFACACCRRIWKALPSEASRRAVEVNEQYADREVKSGVRQKAEEEARSADRGISAQNEPWKMYAAYAAWHAAAKDAWEAASSAAEDAKWASTWYAEPHSERGVGERQERAATKERRSQCDLLRDIFGPLPFRPIAIDPILLSWNDNVVSKIAQAIYEERSLPGGILDSNRLAVLADALEEAGCLNEELLGHLRSPGPHVRGCWVVDLLLSKK